MLSSIPSMPSRTGCCNVWGFPGCSKQQDFVGFYSNSKAMWGIHLKTCSVRLDVQRINLPKPPNPPVNCNSFVPFAPLRGCTRDWAGWVHLVTQPGRGSQPRGVWHLEGGYCQCTQAIGLHKSPLHNQPGVESSQEPQTPSAHQPRGSQHCQPHVPGRGMKKSQPSPTSARKCDNGRSDWLQRGIQ